MTDALHAFTLVMLVATCTTLGCMVVGMKRPGPWWPLMWTVTAAGVAVAVYFSHSIE